LTEVVNAPEKVLERLGPGGRAGTITLGELVNEPQLHAREQRAVIQLLREPHNP
jgi:hypothetical protein